ncbi:MAG TPA: MauE/DoxX family redox-associated membrane protein [Acidimicrobiales bacterium]|nr:MauE/DoxX family redox-associated membrane protein [Acidimicrobiales bacterium]
MSGFGYACAVVLAAVFVRAGVAKVVRPRETTIGFAAVGVPSPGAAARAVPVAELVLAVLLLAVPRAGGVAAVVLLAVFSVLLAGGVRRGVTAGCNCFGAARVEPVSGIDLLRNGLLALLALAALLAPAPRAPGAAAIAVTVVLVTTGVAALTAARRARRRS